MVRIARIEAVEHERFVEFVVARSDDDRNRFGLVPDGLVMADALLCGTERGDRSLARSGVTVVAGGRDVDLDGRGGRRKTQGSGRSIYLSKLFVEVS